jgi:hypothetical protein
MISVEKPVIYSLPGLPSIYSYGGQSSVAIDSFISAFAVIDNKKTNNIRGIIFFIFVSFL